MSCSVPVLILAFNRPEKTAKVLAQIRTAAPVRVYAHCDGPRSQYPADLPKVAEVRRLILEHLSPLGVKTLFREKNAGLRKGVYDALNWFFEQEEYGIILEDDCVPDPSLFPFCAELLLRYYDDPEIMHIGCSNLAEANTQNLTAGYFFSRFPLVWGWASWRRAWQKMAIDMDGLERFERNREIRRFIPGAMEQAYISTKFRATQKGEMNSWAYSWFYSILKNNGLCIIPKINLVQNVGVGEADATNTTGYNKEARKASSSMHFPLTHPAEKSVNPKLEKQIFYASQKKRLRLPPWYLLHALGLR
ncbi:MAG: nucleotide-diphospho-sugar transferase [Thermoanaerobaculia bacterium]|nr:nucleotide-diphospho-sugar transferase [Thermoanaerobaculia bacterium]